VSDAGAPGRAVEAVWRIESARLIAGLARMTGDVGLSEDLAQDALVAALERWPQSGVPENPGAWLTATAKNRAIDLARRGRRFENRREQLAHEAGMRMAMDAAEHEAATSGPGDDLLALIFTCCHPLLGAEARVALTLRLTPSPVVELNRAVAVGMAFGPAGGLELVDGLLERGELAGYHLLFSVRADLLAKLDRPDEARAEFERAAAMTENARERELMLARAAVLLSS